MKKLVFATLLCGSVAQLGGCIIVGDDSGDDPPPPPPPDANDTQPDANLPPGPGEFLVTWTLLGGEPVNDVQSEVTCRPDTPDIRITADPDPNVPDDEDIYLYDCALGQELADGLPAGTYDVWVDLLDADGNLVAQSDAALGVPLDFEEQVPLDFVFSIDHGTFGVSWEILDNAGDPISCDEVGATDVSLLLTVADNQEQSDDYLLDCVDGKGESGPLPLLDYVASLALVDIRGTPDDAGDDIVFDSIDEPIIDLTLEYGNDFVDLGTVTFTVP